MQSWAEAITFQASPDFVNRSFFLGAGDLQNILTQVNPLISMNCFSKQATNFADVSILKIWAQSVNWLKS